MEDCIKQLCQQLKADLVDSDPQTAIKTALTTFANKVVIASSLGLEDQVITHMALEISNANQLQCRIFVIDTGRLHDETLNVLTRTQTQYQFKYEVLYPDAPAVDALVQKKGAYSFYESIENRRECCMIRKVHPLHSILKTADAWITGQRQEQSETRDHLDMVEWDDANQKIKFNPLVKWSTQQVWNYINANDVPVNALHQQGYPSIGCEPCTRAVKPGESLRSGRWWWESSDQKECGLHPSSSHP